VGYSLGRVADREIDTFLLPKYLKTENHKLLVFIKGYIWSRYYINSWSWVDALDKSGWDSGQVGQFLSYLPFTSKTWNRVEKWLGNLQGNYWLKTDVIPYLEDEILDTAIEKLIEYGRAHAAISCFNTMRCNNQPINVDLCVKALLVAVSSSEPSNLIDVYHIVELIQMLQENPEVAPDNLFRVEWAYLPLLDGHRGATPKALENRLASDPEFFCELIRLIYRSKTTNDTINDPSEKTKAIATNAYQLLIEWQTVPGVKDSSFNDTHFSSWIHKVREICMESGHLEVAFSHIGQVLIHCPPDTDGLWINRIVANEINAKDADDIREGFSTGIYNSRGVHWVDPKGQPELELAEQYRQKAEQVENAGYQRFAVTLRGLSEAYEREAQRVKSSHWLEEE
jgi:hypothetical protein